MPRTCTACSHPQRPEIDRALVDGTTYRTIADRYGLSETALKRHKSDHIPGHVAKAQDAREAADADDLLTQLKALRNKAISILQKAETSGDYRTALMGIREARGCIETLMEVEGELDRRGVVNVIVAPEWVHLRTVIVTALASHPEARQAVTMALEAVAGGNHHDNA